MQPLRGERPSDGVSNSAAGQEVLGLERNLRENSVDLQKCSLSVYPVPGAQRDCHLLCQVRALFLQRGSQRLTVT